MRNIVFRNLQRSDLMEEVVINRFDTIAERFPDLQNSRPVVTISMENSPVQSGPDVFTVKVQFMRGTYKDLILEKSASNFYTALAQVIASMHERLVRHDEKSRSLTRQKKRRYKYRSRTRTLEDLNQPA